MQGFIPRCSLTYEKLFTLDNKNKGIYFVLFSFNRNFATKDKNNKQYEKSISLYVIVLFRYLARTTNCHAR